MYRCVPQNRRLDQRIGHLGIGDMELVRKDVGPDAIFQREGAECGQRRSSFAPGFAATFGR